MREKFKELILSLDEKGLKELYQMCNIRYFELYINGNENLESFNDYDLEKEYKEYINDIIKSFLEHYQQISICDDELIKLIEEIK